MILKFILSLILFALPYGLTSPWKFLLLTPLFIFFSAKIFQVHFTVKFKTLATVIYIFLALALLSASTFVTNMAVAQAGLQTLKNGSLLWTFSPIFQALHEEFTIRTILLKCARKFGPIASSFFLAFAFAAAHFVLYGFGFEKVQLQFSVLVTLFCFGFASNLIFIENRNFLIPYIFHMCWNLARFRNLYLLDGKPLKEGDSFNLIEGSMPVVTLSVIFFIFAILFYVMNKKRIPPGVALHF